MPAPKDPIKRAEWIANMSVAQKKRYEDPAEHTKSGAAISAGQKKHYESQAERDKTSAALTGISKSPEHIAALKIAQKKRFENFAERAKISVAKKKYYAEHPEAQARENNGNWDGGVSDLPYDQEFTPSFKESIRARDKVCQLCGKTPEQNGRKLDVHHCEYGKITKDDTFITLCRSCNKKVDKRSERKFWTDYFWFLLYTYRSPDWATKS